MISFACALIAPGVLLAGTPRGQVVGWGQVTLPYIEPGTVFTQIAAGLDHGLALTSSGKVVAWGWNYEQ